MFHQLFLTPTRSIQQWGIIFIVALAMIMTPQFEYNDWARNTAGLPAGLSIYDDPNAVYPPWGLILLWPYYLIGAPGSRVASVLVVGWLATQQRWSLLRFLAIVLNPFFIWTMLFSNIDIVALLLPVVLWRATDQWHPYARAAGRGVAMSLLLLKPQAGALLTLYWLLTNRRNWQSLIIPLLLVVLITLPISLVATPPLLVQWIDNVRHPSAENLEWWDINNVSLTDNIGLLAAVVLVIATIGGLYWGFRSSGKPWTEQNHTTASILLASMLISPYASVQSAIVPIALVPSWKTTIFYYVVSIAAWLLSIPRDLDPFRTLIFGLVALFWFPVHERPRHRTRRLNRMTARRRR